MHNNKKRILFIIPIVIMLYWIIFRPSEVTVDQDSTTVELDPELLIQENASILLKLEKLQQSEAAIRSKMPPVFTDTAAGKARKKLFIEYFLPLIDIANKRVMLEKNIISVWKNKASSLDQNELSQLKALTTKYRMKNFDILKQSDWDDLLAHVDIVPVSLALAQGANESAWGTSRFARKANNYYGQWCFSKGCGLVPQRRGEGKIHEVAKFAHPADSVASYIKNINRHNAYKDLRKIRAKLRQSNQPITGIALAEGLGHYSERGEAYIKDLQSMIHFNKIEQYD